MALIPAASSYKTFCVVYASSKHATSASKQADGKLIFTNFMPTCGVSGVKKTTLLPQPREELEHERVHALGRLVVRAVAHL